MAFENLTDHEKTIVYIVIGVSGGLIVILLVLSIYLLTVVTSLKKKVKNDKEEEKDTEEEDNDSIEDGRQTINNQPYNQHVYDQDLNHEPPFMINPYNPTETYQIKRAKLIQSLRNKIYHSNSRSEQDLSYPQSDINSNYEDDYPHPKHGTLKNEILKARSKMSKKPPAPKDWTMPGDRRSYADKQMSPPIRDDYNLPPRDYPGFPGAHSSQFNRKPYAQSVDNYPVKQRGMSRQEAEVMKQYDQTIANEERHFQNQGFLHGRYAK